MANAVGSKWDTSRSEWTLEERIEGLRSLSRRFWDSPIDDPEVRRLALGWWIGYPAFFVGHSPPKFENSRDLLHDLTNAVHEAAVKFLMRLALKHGLDAGALSEAGRLCRELFANQELWNTDAKSRSCPTWPDCLGRRRFALSQDEQVIIREGENVFQELFIMPQKAGDKPGKWAHVWTLIVKHNAQDGAGMDQVIASEHNKLCAAKINAGKCEKINAAKVAQIRYEHKHRDRHRNQKHKQRS